MAELPSSSASVPSDSRGRVIFASAIASTLVAIAMNVLNEKYGTFIPDWLTLLVVYAAIALWGYAAWHSQRIQRIRALLYTKPNMLFLFIIGGALVGGIAGAGLWLVNRNEQRLRVTLEAETHESQDVAPSTHFRVAISTLVKYRFPGILFLLYSDSTSEYLAPVGLQVLVSVTNNDPTLTKIEGYAADVLVGDQWIRVFSLPGIDPKNFFLAQEQTLTKAHRIDFSENSFDTLARNRLLQSGEPLKGWMFFEWPANLRHSDSDVPIRKLRLHIENASGQRETHELELPARLSNGESEIKGDWAGWIFPEEVNIRERPVKPYMDRKAEAAARIEKLNKHPSPIASPYHQPDR